MSSISLRATFVAGVVLCLAGVAEAQLPVPLYRQCGESWSGDRLGTCDLTMCDAGCAVTSKAMIFAYYGGTMDPGELNACLRSSGGYADGCLVYWNDTCAPPGVHYAGSGGLAAELAAGYPVLTQVRSSRTSMHFVVITGEAGGGDYHINDPGWTYSTIRAGGYEIVRLHNYHGTVGPPPHPVLELAVAVAELEGQEPDACGPDGVFDLWAGQSTTLSVTLTNVGDGVGSEVELGIEVDSPYLEVASWLVLDDWPGHDCGEPWCPNDSNDNPDNPPHERPGSSFVLGLYSLSPDESKRVDLVLEAALGTLPDGAPAQVRAWVRRIARYYDKPGFDSPFENVEGYQSWNGGDLRVLAELDVLDLESCNGADDDCDGEVDEDGCDEPDGGRDAGPDAGPDGGEADGSSGDDSSTSMSGNGCECRAGGRGAEPGLPVPLLLGALALLGLRRR